MAIDRAMAHRRAYGYTELLATLDLWQWGIRYLVGPTLCPDDAGRFHQCTVFLRDAELWADPCVAELPAPEDT